MLSSANMGSVNVITTSNRGLTPEECAEMCTKRIVAVSETAPPVIKEQASQYSRDIERVIVQYMKKAVRSDRTTVYNALVQAGHPDLAKLIMEI